MKICVLNLSGNVGKSTLAVHLFAAFQPGARIVSVESINTSAVNDVKGIEVQELGASRFKEIFREIMVADDVIVDVGASNVSAFMDEMRRFKSAVGEFDLVVVPTVPAEKQQRDTVATIEWLAELGLDGRKVRLLFNQYPSENGDPLEIVYSHVVGYLQGNGMAKAVWEPHAVVDRNEVYELQKEASRTVRELAADKTDWRAARQEAKQAGDFEGMERAMAGQMNHDLAQTAQQNLADVHAVIFSGRPEAAAPAPAARKRA